jgi:hypothetical protein
MEMATARVTDTEAKGTAIAVAAIMAAMADIAAKNITVMAGMADAAAKGSTTADMGIIIIIIAGMGTTMIGMMTHGKSLPSAWARLLLEAQSQTVITVNL